MKLNAGIVKNSLAVMDKVFAGMTDYRVLGSLLVAAINGKLHRELHDIDLLIDKEVYKEVARRFEEQGFKKIHKHAPGFEWDEFVKPNYLTFGVLLVGKFGKAFFDYRANRWLKLRIKKEYLKPTEYHLYGHKIRGIPVKSIYEGIKIANLNKKRRIDRTVVEKYFTSNIPESLSINRAFRVNLFGVDIPYLYTFYSHIYNIIGGIRLRIGKTYDPWM